MKAVAAPSGTTTPGGGEDDSNDYVHVHRVGTSSDASNINSNLHTSSFGKVNVNRHRTRFVGIASVACLVMIAASLIVVAYQTQMQTQMQTTFAANQQPPRAGGINININSIPILSKEQQHTLTLTSTDQRHARRMSNHHHQLMSGMERLLESEPGASDGATQEDELVAKIAEKLKPVPLRFFGDNGQDEPENGDGPNHEPEIPNGAEVDGEVGVDGGVGVEIETITTTKKDEVEKPTMIPHQFLHLHHMKTGGTSIDKLLRCSMDRLRKEANYEVPYYSIHECSRSRFANCLTDPTNGCRDRMNNAAVMSYCSALKYLDEFGWWHDGNEDHTVKAFTVLRNPVDRVWSMFRFQTKNCFKCRPLKEIYETLDKGEDTGLDKLCLDQLQNHEVNNLLSTEWPLEVTELEIEIDSDHDDNDSHKETRNQMVREAIDNMKGFFTVIGITEELVATSTILGTVFPWMDLDGSQDHGTSSQCALSHANASPSNNRCGEGSTHWELPPTPDPETRALIETHNSMDMELYEAAVSYFELQKRALGLVAANNNE